MSERLAKYNKILATPQGRALLDTIRMAEGTYTPKDNMKGYRTMFGGGTFDDLSRHPDVVVKTPGYASAAAGAYQFLPGTWARAQKALGTKGFGKEAQDLGALYLIDQRQGALDQFMKGGKFGEVIAKLAPEWASLPTLQGQSAYGQPVKNINELYEFYEKRKKELAGGGMQLPDAGATQPMTPSRPVEDIIPGALRGAPMPEQEKKSKASQGLLDLFKERIVKDIIGPIIGN